MKVDVLLRKNCPRCDVCKKDVYLYMSVQISNVVRWQRNGEDAMFFCDRFVCTGWLINYNCFRNETWILG